MDTQAICRVLEGKIRGKPVAICRFEHAPPENFEGMKIDPCQILRHAMDDGKRVYFDREHQDCVHGAYITGVHPGNEQIRSGRLLTDYIPVYNLDAAHTFNSGEYILPQGTVKGFCAAPLDNMPAAMTAEWIVVVCPPAVAALVGAAREQYGLEITLPWDEDALAAIVRAPGFVRKMAVGNVEDYAAEQGQSRISLELVRQQAESVGMGRFMKTVGDTRKGLFKRIFGKRP